MTLVHLIRRPDWHAALADGSVPRAPEGFVHLSTDEQVVATAGRYYADVDDLLVLVVEESEVADDLEWEESHPGQFFPHVYDELRVTAVRGVFPFSRPFALPPALGSVRVRLADPDQDAAAVAAVGDVIDGRRPTLPVADLPADRVESYRNQLARPGGVSLVYEEDRRVLSAIVAVPSLANFGRGDPVPGLAHVSSVATHPEAWGRGLATLLLHHLDRGLAESGYERAELWTQCENERARRVYERHGYTPVASAPHAYDALGEKIMQYEHTIER